MAIKRDIRTPIMHRTVTAGNLVFTGGCVADDTSASMADQTRNILKKIGEYLEQVGSGLDRVVSATIFVTDLSKKKEMDAVWTEVFGEDLPARATVGINDLGGGAMIEVVTTAHA